MTEVPVEDLCLKWIDGNTVTGYIAAPIIPQAASFNVDNPDFWLPITVISGLASGFCERAAVISGGSVGGNTWEGATDVAKAALVSNCANNIAKGVAPNATMTNMFATADATFSIPTSAAVSTYMKTVDTMITRLIGPGGYVKDVNGHAYGYDITAGTTGVAFDDLADIASSRAETYLSACELPVSGATAFQAQFMPSYPVEWAKERKWLLDDLRFVGGGGVAENIKPTQSGELCYCSRDTNVTAHYSSVESCRTYYTARASSAGAQYLYCGLTSSSVDSQGALGRTLYMTAKGYYNDNSSGKVSGWMPVIAAAAWDSPDFYSWLGNNQAIKTVILPAATDRQTNVSMYIAQGSIPKDDTIIYNQTVIKVTGATTATGATSASHKYYEVKAGGALTISNGQRPYSVIVSSGGSVIFANGAAADTCVIIPGGTYSGVINAGNLSIDDFYPFGPYPQGWTSAWEFGRSGKGPASGTFTRITENSTYTTGSRLYISGATLTVDRKFISSGTMIIDNGGLVCISGATYTSSDVTYTSFGGLVDMDVRILSGGTLSVGMYTKLDSAYDEIYVYKGGVFTKRHDTNVAPGTNDGIATEDNFFHLYAAPGSTINITIAPDANNITAVYEWHMNGTGHFHFKQNGFKSQDADDKPTINVTYVVPGTEVSPTLSVIRWTHLYMFNAAGLAFTGAETSLTAGYNVTNVSIPANISTVSIGSYTDTGIPADNQPDSIETMTVALSSPYYGAEQTSIIYRCGILSVDVDVIDMAVDHYKDFRVRQYYSYDQSETPPA